VPSFEFSIFSLSSRSTKTWRVDFESDPDKAPSLRSLFPVFRVLRAECKVSFFPPRLTPLQVRTE